MKILIAMGLALFVQSSFAVSIAGKEFAAVADTFVGKSSSAVFTDNDPTQSPSESITDTDPIISPASGIMSGDSNAYMDLAFSTNVFDGAGLDLSIFFLGDDGDHSIDLTLFKADNTASLTRTYSITPSVANYTGFFVDNNNNGVPDNGIDTSIFFMDIDLADFNFLGVDPLAKFRMDISGYSAVPSLIGAYPASMAPVPVPAAVWLFGSGLIGLVGVARRKK